MTTNILESIARPQPPSKAVLSAEIVPFRPEPDPIIYCDTAAAEEWQRPWKHVQDAYPVTDPLEYFFYSVISGAAIAALDENSRSQINLDRGLRIGALPFSANEGAKQQWKFSSRKRFLV